MQKKKHPDKRYYHRLFRKASRFRVDLEKREWFNLWHQHFDWEGFGDINRMHHRRHLSALLRALARARVELLESGTPYQLFAIVHERDSGGDAVFVHTENPHDTVFPCPLIGRALKMLPPLLAGRVDLDLYRVLVRHHEGAASYVIEPRENRARYAGADEA